CLGKVHFRQGGIWLHAVENHNVTVPDSEDGSHCGFPVCGTNRVRNPSHPGSNWQSEDRVCDLGVSHNACSSYLQEVGKAFLQTLAAWRGSWVKDNIFNACFCKGLCKSLEGIKIIDS